MKRRTTICVLLLLLALALLTNPGGSRTNAQKSSDDDRIEPEPIEIDSPELGVATGDFVDKVVYFPSPSPTPYESGIEQSFKAFTEQTMSEFKMLNAKFIRIEAFQSRADGSRIPLWVYGRFVQQAKARGLKVIVLVNPEPRPHRRDDDGADIQNWINNFMQTRFNPLIEQAFNSDETRPFGYEIGNEPNIFLGYSQACPDKDGRCGFTIGGNATAAIARQVRERLRSLNRYEEKIISAGTANTYHNVTGEKLWWDRFFGSSAFHQDYTPTGPKIQIFDYMGIHPYNGAVFTREHIRDCINQGSNGCFQGWKTRVSTDLTAIRQRLVDASNTEGSELMITEFGWQLPRSGADHPCPTEWSEAHNCVSSNSQLEEAMQVSLEAFQNNYVRAAIWHNYRDDDNERFGLRGIWNTVTKTFPAKSSWVKFRDLAGGAGSAEDAWQRMTACPPGATEPCPKRYSEELIETFRGPVEILSRKGYIEGIPEANVYPYSWKFEPNQHAKRRDVARVMARVFLDKIGCGDRRACGYDLSGLQPFNDVQPNDRDYGYIETARKNNILHGYTIDNTYRPDLDVTRAQTCKIVVLTMGWPLVHPPAPHFSDVPEGHWAYEFIETAYSHGLVTGYEDGEFRPGAPVTRGQLSQIVSNALPTQQQLRYNWLHPESASHLSANAVSPTSIEFRWQDAPAASGFWLDIATSPEELEGRYGSFQNYHAGTATSYLWQSLTPGTTYYWRVWTYNDYGGYQAYPAIRSVTTSGAPPAPATNLRTTVLSATSIEFQWNRSTLASGYWLDIATSAEELQGMYGSFRNYHAGAALGLTLENLTPGTPYYWRIYAYNAYGGTHSYPTPPTVTTHTAGCGSGFTGTKYFASQTPGIGHQVGRLADTDWVANVYQDGQGYMVYGPYDRSFGQGFHRATFKLMIDNNTAVNDPEVTLDVVTEGGGRVLARRVVYRHEFTAANQWQTFTLDFNDPCFGAIEARVYYHDRAKISFSHLSISH